MRSKVLEIIGHFGDYEESSMMQKRLTISLCGAS
jgi:hypothetical protein